MLADYNLDGNETASGHFHCCGGWGIDSLRMAVEYDCRGLQRTGLAANIADGPAPLFVELLSGTATGCTCCSCDEEDVEKWIETALGACSHWANLTRIVSGLLSRRLLCKHCFDSDYARALGETLIRKRDRELQLTLWATAPL